MKNYIFHACFLYFFSFTPSLFNKSFQFFYNGVEMYWTRLPFVSSFVKMSLCRGWLTCVDVQTRWCYMDVETRNMCFCDHEQKDVVQMLRRMYSFRFSDVSRQQPPVCEWLCRVKMWHGLFGPTASPTEAQTATDTMTWDSVLHSCLGNNALITEKWQPTLLGGTNGSIPHFPPVPHFIISKSSLYIFLWGNEPLTF